MKSFFIYIATCLLILFTSCNREEVLEALHTSDGKTGELTLTFNTIDSDSRSAISEGKVMNDLLFFIVDYNNRIVRKVDVDFTDNASTHQRIEVKALELGEYSL